MELERRVLYGECWKTGQNQRFACFVNRVGTPLWAVGWKAFTERGTGAEVCFEREALVLMKGGLEGGMNGGKIICWLAVSSVK